MLYRPVIIEQFKHLSTVAMYNIFNKNMLYEWRLEIMSNLSLMKKLGTCISPAGGPSCLSGQQQWWWQASLWYIMFTPSCVPVCPL
jgi:hypothetical protein